MDNSNGQLQIKYQKLATEYSKIRAQANVLKRAVIDEQARNTEIREQLKVKEVELRRAEQELDSLNFRNQQLTKRVTVLQEDLDDAQNKTAKKGKNKAFDNKVQQLPPPVPNHILDEEFQKKIMENAQLLSQISDKNIEIDNLLERIQHLEYKLELSEKSRVELDNKYRETIEKLERERNDAQRRLNEKLKQEETVSWSSGEGKRDGYDLETKSGYTNHRPESSPFSSPSASRRSSKSTVEMGPLRKTWSSNQDENSEEFEFSKLCELEKELNHWKAQYNIIRIKYEELNQKENSEIKVLETSDSQPSEVSNMLGRLTVPFAIPEEIEAREMKIKEYFLREIDKLVTEKHLCHVRNLAIAANTEVMNVHLDTSEEKRAKCEASLMEALSQFRNLQDDKEIQEGNYKLQLSTMSEHLANMNEKLICQTEEIQQLKFELSNKNGKRGR
ncbi:hypothetical protein QAD02_004734 [Eretmocerus hayati]|uniref:Uncharacterized protein n=1 Tax=Eretmocerus hayati TaxID=131215 RepID=A0ACC2NQT3_9HYME|nr:hypothetical protein QAD02_004734 [Eretmocerus hayati]